MTPEQHRNQAAMLRLSEDPEAQRRATIHETIAVAIERRSEQALAGDAWNEADHPRGQPGNAGQFGSGGGGGKAKASKPAPTTAPAPAAGGSYGGQYATGGSPKENHVTTAQRVLSKPVSRGIHYRRMLGQLIREAPEFGTQSSVPGLKKKLIAALDATATSERARGRDAEADKAQATADRLRQSMSAQAEFNFEQPQKAKPQPQETPKAQAQPEAKPQKAKPQPKPKIEKPKEAKTPDEPMVEIANVSPEFEKEVRDTIAKIPKGVKAAMAKHGVKIRVGKYLTDLYPKLKGVTPRGWPAGTSWDQAEGLYQVGHKEIAATEYAKTRHGQDRRTHRGPGVINHEAGHGFDYSINGSRSTKFMEAYRADVDKMPSFIRTSHRLSYFMQPGDAGPSEAFAEIFAQELGAGSSPDNIRKDFPEVTKLMREMMSTA